MIGLKNGSFGLVRMALHKKFIFCSGLNTFRKFVENFPDIACETDCAGVPLPKAQPMQTNPQCFPLLPALTIPTAHHSVTCPIESILQPQGTP